MTVGLERWECQQEKENKVGKTDLLEMYVRKFLVSGN
jgi:hypothetical protein